MEKVHQVLMRFSPRIKMELNEMQRLSIANVVAGKSVFVQAPTGSGKSLVYQLPAFLPTSTLTVVVSPLIALIHDQRNNLAEKMGIENVLMFTGNMDIGEKRKVLERLHVPTPTVLITTPESLLSGTLSRAIEDIGDRKGIERFVLDEAQCIASWGETFRTDYITVCTKMASFDDVPMTLLTAVCTRDEQDTIFQSCSLSRANNDDETDARSVHTVDSFHDRTNLRWEVAVVQPELRAEDIKQRIGKTQTIIYTLTKDEADTVARDLSDMGLGCKAYHSGLTSTQRSTRHNYFRNGKIQILVATVAYGMGIDLPYIGFVMLYSIPLSLSMYYQQIVRYYGISY